MKKIYLVLLFAAATLSGCAYTRLATPESFDQKLVKPRSERAVTNIERAVIGRPTVIEPVNGENPSGHFVDNLGS
jgi:hypothetical protein